MHPGMGQYQQNNSMGGYGQQGGQYGPQGLYLFDLPLSGFCRKERALFFLLKKFIEITFLRPMFFMSITICLGSFLIYTSHYTYGIYLPAS